MTCVRTNIYVVSMSLPAVGHIAHARALRQYCVQEVGRSGLDIGCGSSLLMNLDVYLDAPERTYEEVLW